MAVGDGGELRINGVTVLGVDRRFWTLVEDPAPALELQRDEVVVNERLARRLGLETGDEFLLRVEKVHMMPQEAPLSQESVSTVSFRVRVKDIAADGRMGRFSLKANQTAPFNIFLSMEQLAREMELPGRANLMLAAAAKAQNLNLGKLHSLLRESWTLSDAGLELRVLDGGRMAELRSDQVFLEPSVERAVLAASPGASGVLTYFVNSILRPVGNGTGPIRETPYSFVSAQGASTQGASTPGASTPGASPVPAGMGSDEIIITQWLADDLGAHPGDSLSLSYFVLDDENRLSQETREFRIREVIPVRSDEATRELMPLFPGLHEAESCRVWEPGFPLDLDRIRDKDEDYWRLYRGTPKAFVALETGREMWTNRFGSLTAVRFPLRDSSGKEIISLGDLSDRIRNALEPRSLGLMFQDVRAQGLRASREGIDFGQLFLALSFFMMAASLLLTGLLFSFDVESRSAETGLLLAVGVRPAQVRRLFLAEGAVIALVGSLLGALCGAAYNRVVVYGLATVWQEAVMSASLSGRITIPTLLTGTFLSILMALAAMGLAARRQMTRPASRLLASAPSYDAPSTAKRARLSVVVAVFGIVGLFVLFTVFGVWEGRRATAAFFGAGGLLLLSGLALTSVFLHHLSRARRRRLPSLARMGVRNSAQRRKRSLTVVGLMACGIFIIMAVGANRRDILFDREERGSGTGGYKLYGETTLPLPRDLDSENLDRPAVELLPFRVLDGDDASCLNLNRVQTPRVLGVDPEALANRGSFSFVRIMEGLDPRLGWSVLNEQIGEDVIPAVADGSVITWGLGKSVGDSLTYIDDSGREVRLRLVGALANSIFQGSVLIAEDVFLERFPGVNGHRLFLLDAPGELVGEIEEQLLFSLEDHGLELTGTAERLAEFHQVENTYLSIFLVLGGLGLIIGSVGLGVVVLRNIQEMRSELALLQAVGFRKRSLGWLVFSEHGLLLAAGFLCGSFSALIAVLPSLLSSGLEVPWTFLIFLLAAITVNGVVWIFLATTSALRGELIPALRNE
jgi:ABC-type antimicrobial peptide transport system permease subunit